MNPTSAPIPLSVVIPAELLDQDSQTLATGHAVFSSALRGEFEHAPRGNADTLTAQAAFLCLGNGQKLKLEVFQWHDAIPYDHFHFKLKA
jgi:hypothetical protein